MSTEPDPFLTRQRHLPALPGTRAFTPEDLWNVPRVGRPVVSPDGTLTAVRVVRFDVEENCGRGRIWLVPTTGGEARPLTAGESDAAGPAFSPDGTRVACTLKKDGGEVPQLAVLPTGGGGPRFLTDLPLAVFDPRWLPDGSGIVFGTMLLVDHPTVEGTRAELDRRKDGPTRPHVTEARVYRIWDRWLTGGEVTRLMLLRLESGELVDLMPDSALWFDWMEPAGQYDLAPDGREVVFAAARHDPERDLLRRSIWTAPVPATGGGATPVSITPDTPAHDHAPRYTADGEGIVFGSTVDPFFYADRVRLNRHDRATGAREGVLTDWDRSPTGWWPLPDGTLVIEAADRARTLLWTLTDACDPQALTSAYGGTAGMGGVGPDGSLYLSWASLSAPPEVHRLDAADGRLHRLSHFTTEALTDVALGEVREMTFEGAGGETVQMFLVLPPKVDGAAHDAPPPLVHVLHGGPHGTSADGFHFRWNAHLFAAPGYAAALVNFQGSASFGQDFAQRIQGAWGDRPAEDVHRATDALVAAGLVDADRIAVAGGSYGGYLVAWLTAHTDRFRCAVNHAGVYDTLAHWSCDITQGRGQSFGGLPWDGLDGIDAWNPARATAGLHTPMLVLHGERDYRVPYTQGLACYNVLQARGIPARLVVFPDENHWVLKPGNGLIWHAEVRAWLERFLGTEPGSRAASRSRSG